MWIRLSNLWVHFTTSYDPSTYSVYMRGVSQTSHFLSTSHHRLLCACDWRREAATEREKGMGLSLPSPFQWGRNGSSTWEEKATVAGEVALAFLIFDVYIMICLLELPRFGLSYHLWVYSQWWLYCQLLPFCVPFFYFELSTVFSFLVAFEWTV